MTGPWLRKVLDDAKKAKQLMSDNIGQEHVTDTVIAELNRLRSENANLRDNIDALVGQRERLKAELLKAELRDAAQLIQGFIAEQEARNDQEELT